MEEIYEELRPLMFAIAYRMLGSVTEAEDVVQEAFLRLQRSLREGTDVESPKAYLSQVTTRLGIDHLRSARVRRETYVGQWLPEPLLTDPAPGPAEHAETADSLSMAFLLLLESLSPVERAVFLLREVFEYDYDEIAAIVEKSEANCRQILSRARKHIEADKPRFEIGGERQTQLADSFLAAIQEGDLERLVAYLAEDAVFYGDGGGKGRGLPKPVFGARNIARLLVGFFEGYRSIGARMQPAQINGQPGVLAFDSESRLINVLAFDIVGDALQNVRSVINPEKLRHLGPVADARRLLRESSP